jgi:general secretion pathway protein G
MEAKDSVSLGVAEAGRASRKRLFVFVFVGAVIVLLGVPAAITGVRAATATPRYVNAVRHAKEDVLKEDLHRLNAAACAYKADRKEPASSVEALVKAGYLDTVPADPMTKSDRTWTLSEADNRIHSGSDGAGSNGQPYNTW